VNLAVFQSRAFTTGTLLVAVVGCGQSSMVFLSSLYSERVMGYSAFATGMSLAPAGLASAGAMLLAGALNMRLGPRPLIVAGTLLAAFGLFGLTRLTPEASFEQLVWPRVLVGVGFGFLLVSLSTATLSALSAVDGRRAAGLFNLVRNVGSGVGLALCRTLLERGVQVHHARLVEQMEPYRSPAAHRLSGLTLEFLARGADRTTAEQQAWVTLHGATRSQAWFLSFLDSYQLLAVGLLLALPFLFLLRAPRETR
jgi:MFS transporter, DHA2 family, multidrug resistance protein